MDRIREIFRLVHLSLWAVFSFLVAFQLHAEGDIHWLGTSVGFISTCLYVFYTHFYLLTHRKSVKGKVGYFLKLAGIVVTGPVLFLLFHHTGWDRPQVLLQYYRIHIATTTPVFILLSWLARITENLVLNTILKEQLEKQAVESELHYLKSQINPHFLFNTLNNIHTLVYKQSPAAPEAVMQLASLMRYMIYESNVATVPLSREMDYLRGYMHLQQLRHKESPVAELQIEGNPESCQIAPLLLIHLLENAYKHSPARLARGAIKLRVAIDEKSLIFTVENPVAKNRTHMPEEQAGIGLSNIRKRLSLLYPARHELTIRKDGDIFTAHLTIHPTPIMAYERKTHLLYR